MDVLAALLAAKCLSVVIIMMNYYRTIPSKKRSKKFPSSKPAALDRKNGCRFNPLELLPAKKI
jgi:hypothetical protein